MAPYPTAFLEANRRTLVLALPIVAGLLGQMLMGVTDTLMVGHVGVVPLAACSFANTLLVMPMVFGFGLLSAVSVSVSHAHGARNRRQAGESLRAGLAIALAMGLAAGIAALAGVGHLAVFGQPAEVNSAVGRYLVLCAWSMAPVFLTGTLKNFSEALDRPWPPFWIMMGGVAANVVLNWILIYGHLGAPAMGLDGAGLATLLSRVLTLAAMAAYPRFCPILRHHLPARWLAGGVRTEAARLSAVGLHSAGLGLCEVGGFSVGSLMMGWLGVVPMAAHQIALSCAATTFMVPLGLGQAVSVRVGHCRGGDRGPEIPDVVHGALLLTVAAMAAFAIAYLSLGRSIAHGFSDDAAVIALTATLLAMAGIFQVFDGIQVVAAGALRGFGDTRVPFQIGIVSYWIVALPVSWAAAFPMGFGAPGVWAGFVCGLGIAAMAMGTRILRMVSRPPVPGPGRERPGP